MAEIAIIGSDIQEVLGTAIALNILFTLKVWMGVLISITSTLLILLLKKYGMTIIECIFAFLIGTMVLCFFYNMLNLPIEYDQIFESLIVPRVPKKSVSALIGLIGSIIMPHNIYLHSSLVLERKINKFNSHEVRKTQFYYRIETAISLFISFIINLTIISTFAYFSTLNYSDDIGL